MRRVMAAAAATAAALAVSPVAIPQPARPQAAVLGLDHVPVAVGDLDAAAARYRQLGFVLKPGRPHANGISNQHVKFADGTEIELITAPAGVDALTRTYRRHLADGDGPAFLALFAPPAAAVDTVLEAAGFRVTTQPSLVALDDQGPLPYMFFGARQRSPTDRPEHFVHPNTASALVSVWLAADDLSAERRMLSAVGARFEERTVFVPRPVRTTVARFAHGDVVLLPGQHQRVPGRRIVGVSVSVRDRRAAARVIGARAFAGEPSPGVGLFVAPDTALGYWLELR